MNRYIASLLAFAFAITGSVGAQEAPVSGPSAPEETEIVVPDLVLQVEELELQRVIAVLPDEGELALGRVSTPLPGATELSIDDDAFSVPVPGGAAGRDATSVFSSGRLGAGTANHVVGELTLYKLGADPRFRLQFSHEGLDGFQFRPAGTGYFSRSNLIEGWLAAGNDRLSVEVEASFSEEVLGLQDVGDSFSAGLRRTSAAAEIVLTPDPLIALTGTLDGSIASRILAASGSGEAPRDQEISVTPGAEARFSLGVVDIVLETSYFLRLLVSERIPLHQSVDLLGGVDVELPASITLGARGGVFWEPGMTLGYPWYVSIGKLFGDALEASLSGGYRVERLTVADIWADVPLAGFASPDATDDLASDGRWFAGLAARWSAVSGLTLTGALDFAAHEATVEPLPYDLVAEEFPVDQRSLLALTSRINASWRPGQRVQVQAGWAGSFLESVAGEPTSSVDGSIRVSDSSDRFSAAAETRVDFYPEAALPLLGLSGSFAPSDEIEFTLEFSDLLAPLLEDGRASTGATVSDDYPFIEPGFRASIFTRISL